MNTTILFTINILLLILSVICLIGLVWLTQLTFSAKIKNNQAIIKNMSDNKLLFAKITVIVIWLQIFMIIISSIFLYN